MVKAKVEKVQTPTKTVAKIVPVQQAAPQKVAPAPVVKKAEVAAPAALQQ